jgi:hypothetical protein
MPKSSTLPSNSWSLPYATGVKVVNTHLTATVRAAPLFG